MRRPSRCWHGPTDNGRTGGATPLSVTFCCCAPIRVERVIGRGFALDLVLRFVVGGTLLTAALEKGLQPRVFIAAITSYRIVRRSLIGPIGVAVIGAEGFAGICLVLGVAQQEAAIVAAALFALFAAAVGINLARGHIVSCHCFGSRTRESIGPATLLRSVILLGCSGALAVDSLRAPRELLPAASDVVAAIFIALAGIMMLRGLSLVSQTWSYLTTSPFVRPSALRRVSFRGAPLDSSFPSLSASNGGGDLRLTVDIFRARRVN